MVAQTLSTDRASFHPTRFTLLSSPLKSKCRDGSKLFDKHHEGGMTLFPLVVKPCAWQEVPWLAGLQLRPPEGKAVSLLRGAKRDEALSIVAREVAAICQSPAINSNVSAAGA